MVKVILLGGNFSCIYCRKGNYILGCLRRGIFCCDDVFSHDDIKENGMPNRNFITGKHVGRFICGEECYSL